jgi:WD40 repeat protein/serine/threonine protein kinase
MTSCPSRSELQQFLVDELVSDAEQTLSAHVEACQRCQYLLEELTAAPAHLAAGPAPSTSDVTKPLPAQSAASSPPSDSQARLSDHQLHRLRHLLPSDSSDGASASGKGVIDGRNSWDAQPQAEWPEIPGYEILRFLGRGGMAVVYEARQLRLNRRVALKILRAGDQATPEQLIRFCAEGEIVARLRHPHIVQIYEVGTNNKQPYFALELMEGGSLSSALQGKPLAARPAAQIVETLARAIEYAHAQGIVHRDLNPSNVLLGSEPGSVRGSSASGADVTGLAGVLKVTDFGLAKYLDQDSRLTRADYVLGTPSYMAPEQVRGQNDRVGKSADIYSLGAVLYELLTGRPPFQAPTSLEVMNQILELDPVSPSRLLPKVPRDLEAICLKCLEKEPERRYASAAALAEDLRRFRAGEPIEARRVHTLERAWRFAKRRPAPVALLLLLLLMAVVGFPAVTLLWLEAASARQRALAQEREALQARNDARSESIRFQQQSAEILAERGREFAQQGDVAKGLHWMLASLRTAPETAIDFHRVVRTNVAAWSRQICHLRHQLDHPDEIDAVAFRPDGQVLAVGCLRYGIYRWNAESGQPHGAPIAPPGQVMSLTYSPDGKTILGGGGSHSSELGDVDCWVRRWDAATGEPLGPTIVHDIRVWAVAYSPDGKSFLVGSGSNDGQKGHVRLWDAATDEPLGPPLPVPFAVKAVAFSPDGQQFATATGALDAKVPGLVQIWNTATQQPIGQPLEHAARLWAVCFSPDGKTLLTAGDDGAVRLWGVTSGKEVAEPLWHPFGVSAIGLTPDGMTVVTGSWDGIIRLWDVATGRLVDAQELHEGWVTSVAVSADGRTLLTGARGDRNARIWDVSVNLSRSIARNATRGDVSTPGRAPVSVLDFPSVAYSPDSKTVLTCGPNGLGQLWETATGRPVGTPLRHPHPRIRVADFSPDGKKVATSCLGKRSEDCAVRIWDATTGLPLTPWIPQQDHVAALNFSPDGKLLATGDYTHDVQLWDAATGERSRPPLRQRDIVLSLAFSPDGKTLAAGTAHDWHRDPQARLWDVSTGRPVGQPLKHTNYVVFVAFSPDGQTLVTGSLDNTFRLWDVATGEARGDYRTVAAGWRCAALSPDGDRLATASQDGTLRLWSTADGSPLPGATMPHPGGSSAVAVAFSPDGTLLVVGHEDGSAQLWDLATFKPLGPPVVQAGRLLGVAFTENGRLFLTTAADGSTRSWPVPMVFDELDMEQLALWLEVRTGLRMDEGQAVARLTAEEWRQRHLKLVGHGAGTMRRDPPVDDQAWHDGAARDAEQSGQTFAARWHVDHLIRLKPKDWLLYARRARTHTEEANWHLAEADYQQALDRAGIDDVLAWYRQRACSCQARRNWPAALWYLDRLLRERPDEDGLQQQRAEVQTELEKVNE